jgi:putative SOS response-associated peptidase YedK
MCGKFAQQFTWGEYCRLAGTGTDGAGSGGPCVMDASTLLSKATPMANVPVLHLGPMRQRRLTAMRWGWYNERSLTPERSFSHLHARSDRIDTAPTWAEAFRERRGVVFTTAFNIGETLPNGRVRQWVCSDPENRPLAIAVIYAVWNVVPRRLCTFAMVTTDACAPLHEKDDRMPALLGLDEVTTWIGESGAGAAELKALLRPYAGMLVMRPQEQGKERNTTRARPKPPPEEPEPTLF